MSGEILARYIVKARIRALGMHVTCFRAGQQGLERDVELRVLPLAGLTDSTEADRFAREFRTLAGFDHPSLIQVLDVGRTQDHLFYATYFRESQTLEEVLKAGRLPEAQAALVASTIGSGLAYLHEHGQLHRSLAPGTLFWDEALKRAFIGDYSSMAPAEVPRAGEPVADVPVLRLAMTPEAGQGLPFDIRTDLYLLGATIYRLVTGVDPLAATARHAAGVRIPAPMQLVPGLSREMDGMLLKALEADPEARFQSAAEFVAAAEHVLKKLELKSLMERTGAPAADEPERVAPARLAGSGSAPGAVARSAPARLAAVEAEPKAPVQPVATEAEEPPQMLSRVRVRAARPASSAQMPAATASSATLRAAGEDGPSSLSRAQVRGAARSSRDRIAALEGGPDASLSAERPAAASGPGGWQKRAREQVEHVTQPIVGLAERAFSRVPESARVPAAILAAFCLLAGAAVLIGLRGRPEELPVAVVEAPGPPQVAPPAAVPDEPAERPLPSVTAEEVRQSPTDLTNFRERWQQLRRWYVTLPPAKQATLFPYESLMRAKLDFAADPRKACQQLDKLYETSAAELR